MCLEGANLSIKVGVFQFRAMGRSVKGPRLSEFYLHLSATPSPPEVVSSSSRAFQRKTVEWAQVDHEPLSISLVAGSIVWGNWG